MARVLLSHFSPVLDQGQFQSLVYYDALVSALVANGNVVKHMISSEFLDKPWNGTNELKSTLDKDKLVKEIQEFSPELCIAFNNSIPRCITDVLTCSITLWHADSFFYFNDREEIKKNIERFYFVCPFEDTANFLRHELKVAEDKILSILPGTGIQKDDVLQNKNISFIGTPFVSGYSFLDYIKNNDKTAIRRVADRLLKGDNTHYQQMTNDEGCSDLAEKVSLSEMASLYSSESRMLTLGLISHMGLEIYGGSQWYDIGLYMPWIAMAYNPQKVYSLKHNLDIYNSSKICLNVSHTQATFGFPWRIMDIMASNGCLVSDKNIGIQKFTKGYVDIPVYESPSEAFELCKKILKDEHWRRDIVDGSQACIEKKGRWVDRFKQLESVFNIDLTGHRTNLNIQAGVEIIRAEKFIMQEKQALFLEKDESLQMISTVQNLEEKRSLIYSIARTGYRMTKKILRI